MKRVGNLFSTLISDDNLSLAIYEVNKTHRRGRHHKLNGTVCWVERTKNARVCDLRKIIIDGFTPTPTKRRTIYDHSSGKYREIHEPALWPDQYIHHALVQVLREPIMRGMDYWCCGSIPGRGISHGVKGIRRWMREDIKDTKYCAELDIHHFYQSISPQIVINQLERIIKDRSVLDLASRTMVNGVQIGNYCSQWFANATLQPLDHMIREEIGVRHYVRYMDNLTLFGANKKKLHKAIREIEKWLQLRGLRLKKNWQVFPTKSRMPNAMGYRFGRGYILPRKKTVLRFKRACNRVIKKIALGREPTFRQACSLLSRMGWLKHASSFRLINNWLAPIGVDRLKDTVRKGYAV